MMTGQDAVPQKHLRIGHVTERGAVNAVRSLLEAHALVVDEVDGRADYGRDLNVDITSAARVTGGIIGIQVKGGHSFHRKGRWVIPATPTDWEYWRSSTLPLIGMVWDPTSKQIRWVNLTQVARSKVFVADDTYDYEVQDDQMTEVPAVKVLDASTFPSFLNAIEEYLRITSSSAFLELLSDIDETRCRGVSACWTLGRLNPAPLVLLRRLVPGLTGASLHAAITALAHATPHPDIFWSPRNWISEPVKHEVASAMRWTPSELVQLVHGVEQLGESFWGWERGGVGQSLWSLMTMDPDLTFRLPHAVRLAVAEKKTDAAVRLLICFQAIADHPLADVLELLDSIPSLAGHEWVNLLLVELEDHGRVDVY